MRTRQWLFAATLFSIALMLIGFWSATVLPTFPIPAGSVEPSSRYYLPDRAANMTRIFLVSATPQYGFYPVEPENKAGPYQIHRGTPCFILTVIIRNDYLPESPIPPYLNPDDKGSHVDAWFCVKAVLNDENGVLHVPAVTPPYPQMPFGIPLFFQKSGTTQSYTLYFATNNRHINHYLIYISYLSGNPAT